MDLLLDSYLRRKLWEHKQQAITVINSYAEAMQPRKGKGKPQVRPAGERAFRTNHGGVNHGPPPLTVLQRVGLEIEGKGF